MIIEERRKVLEAFTDLSEAESYDEYRAAMACIPTVVTPEDLKELLQDASPEIRGRLTLFYNDVVRKISW